MRQLLYKCMTKATIAEGDHLRHSKNWLLARRGQLMIYDDRFVCGDWTILFTEIDEAVLYQTSQMFIPCYVLWVKSGERIYQFGLNAGRFWNGELPFAIRRERARLKHSWFSIAIRSAAVIALGYWLWRKWNH